MAIQHALLLIADISGYTRFMKVHRVNLAHAQDIVARLLEAVIDGAGRRLRLSKLEGDAALFYALLPQGEKLDFGDLDRQLTRIRRAFTDRREQMRIDRICTCDGCTQVGDLRLKFVVHAGEIGFQRIRGFTEIAGIDVILVHRMLKNSVPIGEYVLMTGSVLDHAGEAIRAEAQEIEEDLEGIGVIPLHYADLDVIAPVPIEPPAPSRLRALCDHVMRNVRSVPYILGLREPCGAFRNMDEALGRAPALSDPRRAAALPRPPSEDPPP